MIDLNQLCADAGLHGADADTAIRAYVAVGPLTRTEADILRAAMPVTRSSVLADLYGCDAARVASIAVEAYR